MNNSKLRILHLADIFFKHTDEENYLSRTQIFEKLSVLDIKITKPTFYEDIEILKEFGLDIRHERRDKSFYSLVNRDFETPELKLIIDVIQSSHFITPKKSRNLIKKLGGLGSIHQSKELEKHVLLEDRVKNTNEHIYYNIDCIYNAIYQKKIISFNYYKYSIDKKLELRRNGEEYKISPYTLTYANDNYYLIAYHPRYEKITHFRVDKMSNITITENNIKPLPNNFNLAKYCRKVFDMYAGELKEVTLKFDISLIDIAIDKFGDKIHIDKCDDKHFIIKPTFAVSPTFFGWIFAFGGKIEILSPHELRQEFKEYGEFLSKY